MASSRVIALATEAANHPTLAHIDCMLLELSYMRREPATIALVNELLELRLEATNLTGEAA